MDKYLEAHPAIDPARDAHFVSLVDMLRRSSNGLIELRMVSSAGELYAIPSLDGKSLTGVKDRAYFTEQLGAGERKLHIGAPVVSRITKKWTIPISWRLEAPISSMLVLVASIELDRLFVLHERLRLKPAGAITLFNSAGVVLSRTPLEPPMIGRSMAGTPAFENSYGVKPHGTYFSDGALTDGVARLASYERLEEYPVIVLVSEGLDDILAPYVQRRNLTLGLTALVAAVIFSLAFMLQRFLWAMYGEHASLERRATIDSLTGILARGPLLEVGQREFSRALRYARPTVIAAIDLDHFKKVNDTHGHAAGDAVLRECCETWLTILRGQDFLGRIGGEEFCAILPETDLEGALHVIGRLREATSRLKFVGEHGEFSVTVSIGLASVTTSDEQFSQVMERADKALYAAKEGGRDRVEVLEPRRLRVVPLKQVT
jgi:diguanylate cyclase (GGDEF)-like protein